MTHSDKIKAGIKKARREGRGRSGNPVLVHAVDDKGALRKAIEESKKRKADEFASRYRQDIEKMLDKGLSLNGVAKHFNQLGIKTVRGKQWTHTTVKNLLTRPLTALEKIEKAAIWAKMDDVE